MNDKERGPKIKFKKLLEIFQFKIMDVSSVKSEIW